MLKENIGSASRAEYLTKKLTLIRLEPITEIFLLLRWSIQL